MKDENIEKLERVRRELHSYSPSSTELIHMISDLDGIIKSERRLMERQEKFNNGICPDCGKRLSGNHVMGKGWTYSPCSCMEPEMDEEALEIIKRALKIN